MFLWSREGWTMRQEAGCEPDLKGAGDWNWWQESEGSASSLSRPPLTAYKFQLLLLPRTPSLLPGLS